MFKEMNPVMQYMIPLTKQELSGCTGDVMEFLQFFTGPVSKFILISSTVPVRMSIITQNAVWHVWLTSRKFQKLMKKVIMHWPVTVTA